MRRGEIWQVSLPVTSGHAQAGDRPALIVQNDRATAQLPTILVVPFTSTQSAARFEGAILIQPEPMNGLRFPSVALVFQLRAIDKRDLTRRLGTVDEVTLAAIENLIQEILGPSSP